MEIQNIEGLSGDQIRRLVDEGGKFVIYKYCISIVVMTFNNPTDIYFIHPGKSAVVPGLGYLFISLLLGWWGIPWGPIYTIGNIADILGGGKDITQEVLADINQRDPNYGNTGNYTINGNVSSATNAQTTNTYNIPSDNNTIQPHNPYSVPSSESSSTNTYNIPQ